MPDPDNSIHHTGVTQITGAEGEGWEFHCNDCGFRMLYYLPECSQEAHLEVISLGDVFARHLSGDITYLESIRIELAEEEWLTPEIRQTIDKILKNCGE